MKSRISMSLIQFLTCLATGIMLAINVLAEFIPLNGKTTAEISNQFQVFFMPAGYVFAIWGLIYVLVIIFTVFQASEKYGELAVVKKVRPWYILSTIANALWLILWHFEFFYLTLVVMGVLLLTLSVIYMLIDRDKENVTREVFFGLKLPFSIYLGWICVATIANLTVALHISQWDAFGIASDVWAALLIGISALVGTYFLTEKKDAGFGAVILWSIIGIGVKFYSDNVMFVASFLGSLILFFLVARRIMKFELPAGMSTKTKKSRS